MKLKTIDQATIDTIHGISERLMLLNNKMVENGIKDTSLHLDWSANCSSVDVYISYWVEGKCEVKSQDSYTWYYDEELCGCTLEGLYKLIEEWETKYGL